MELTAAALWTQTLAAVQSRVQDYALVAAAFTFLPNVVSMRYAGQSNGAMLIAGLIGLIGQIAIVRLAARPDTDTGDAIRGAVASYLPALAVTVLTGIATLLGFIALILPGFYLLARLLPALPELIVGGGNVEDALRKAWAMTDGKTLPILVVAIGLLFLFVISAFIAGGLAAIVSGSPDQVSLLGAILLAAVASVFTIYYAVLQGTVWRALAAKA